MPNTELLRRTLAHIEAHPFQWDQDSWAIRTECGTSYCFAGTALMLSEIEPDWREADRDEATGDLYTRWANVGGKTRLISDVAQEALELSDSDAARLFDPYNDLEALRHIVAQLTAHEPYIESAEA
jgi:hypothetical protein